MFEDFPTGCAVQKPLPKPATMASDATLRDYFAAAALQGFCSMSDSTGCWAWPAKDIPKAAYQIADAMIAERNRND